MADLIQGVAIEGSTIYLLARVNGNGGVPITQADITSIACEAWKVNPPAGDQQGQWQAKWLATSPPVKFSSPAIEVADSVLDTLEDDDERWTVDDVGYNFIFPIKPTLPGEPGDLDVIALADYPKGQWYRIDVRFTPAAVDESPFIASYLIEQQSSLIGKDEP